ncbi:hypothetical protein RI129_000437 [Pyrocoelia pectoralis]|uniref:Microtubule-associated protein futsch n=1 Tax=Pyrocoelia pectoralis TaxID=417401 RepID=A0AAN7VU92_9COLE
MEAVNGVSELDKGGPPAPSPLTGCYLLIVVGEPHSKEHKDIILRRIAKGLLSWDSNSCHVDLEKELAIISEQAPEGEDARYGERLIQFASENLVTEVLIHPAISTLSQCMKNLLSSFTRHRHIIHAGYTFAGNGSWILQDGTLSLTDFSEAFQEIEVQRVLRAYDNTISLDIHCSILYKNCKLRLNPDDVLTSGSPAIVNFLNYISPFLIPTDIEMLLESSDVVGNIRFSHPTLYVFPGGQGDAALFGINGFNMLVDGGFGRKACFWDFVRHLDRLDAVLLTRLNNSNVNGISSVLRRKRHNTVYPHIGHFFCNIQERKAILSPDGDKDKDPLLINLFEEGQDIMNNLRQLNLQPQSCYREIMPMNLYHKVGHGTLDMYILSPSRDSKEVKEFLQKWNNNDHRLFSTQKNGKEFVFPTYNLVSICALLVWQPANMNDNITRILFPGSSPQHKIFEGLDKLKQLECIKNPSCSAKTLTSTIIKTKLTKTEKIVQDHKEIKPKSVIDGKPKMENKIVDEDIKNGHTNGITQPISEKIIKKHDSTESEKSGTQIIDTKKLEVTKDLVNGKATDEKIDKFKAKPKPEPKIKPEMKTNKNARSLERRTRPPASAEKKASPTTPKKTVETKINGDATRIKPAAKISPSATPAKSAKDANNRKVVESKIKSAPKREAPKPGEKKETKPERKPISRRPKGTSPVGKTPESPIKKVMELHKFEARKPKLEKECTTDSSTVSTPSADVDSTVKKDLSKLTPEEIEQLKARELAELKEEQEVVKEIEAVFRKSESKETDDSDMRKIKNISIDEKTEGEGEEYLIIEKEEMDHDSLDEKDAKESETQKHLRDSEESEKQRKLSDVIESVDVKEKPTEDVKTEIVQEQEMIPIIHSKEEKELPKAISKEVSVTSPTDKIEESSGKKITDREIEEEIKDINILESQPDEKFSTPIESGATTAPTLPEDERIPLDEIKEDNGDLGVEEKYVKEDTKEKEVPVVQLPPKTIENVAKIPTVVGIRLDKQTPMRDIVKTPDEVADLPVHEEVDIENYEQYQANQAHTPKQGEPKLLPTKIKTDEAEIPDNESAVKAPEVEICEKIDEEKHDAQKITDKSDVVADKVIVQDEVVTPALEDNKLTEKQLEHEGPQTTAPSHETEIDEPAEIKSAKDQVLIESKPTLVESVEKTDMEKDVPAKEVELKDDKSIDELKKLEEEIVDANKLVIEDENKRAPKDDAIETVIEKGIGEVSDVTAQTLKEATELEDESPYESRRVEVSMERTEVKIEKIHGAKSDKTKETVEEDEKDKDTTEDLKTDIEQVEEIQLAEKVQLVEAQELMQEVKEDIHKIQADLIDSMDDEGAGKDIVIDALKSAEQTVDSVCKAIQDDVEKVTKVEEPAVEVNEILELDSKKEQIVDAIQDGVEKVTKVEEPAVEVKEVLELDSKKEQIVDAIQDDVEKTTKVEEPAVEVNEILELDSKKEQIVDAIQDDVEKITKVDEPAVEVKEVLELDSKKEQIVDAIQDGVEKTTKVEESAVEVKEVLELDSKKEQIVDAIQDGVEKIIKVEEPAVEVKEVLELDSKKEEEIEETKDKQFVVQTEEEIKKDTILPTEGSKEELKSSEGEVAEQKEPIIENGLDLPEDDAIAEITETSPVAEPESKQSEDTIKENEIKPDPVEIKLEKEVLDDAVIVTEEGDAEETIDDHEAVIRSVREDSLKISKIDKKLQELKESVESDTKSESKETALIKAELDLVDKLELGRKSPKEREQDVAKIVASVAEVLKSDAPLEEFEGKIPLDVGTFTTFAPYTTELRETHITTLESPIRDIVVESMVMEPIEEEKIAPLDTTTMFINEEKRIASVHTGYDTEFIHKEPSRVSSLLKDSNDLIQATSKMISDIKHTSKVDDKTSQTLEDISAAKQEASVKEVQKSPLSSGKISPDLKDTTLVDKIVPEETKTDEESKDVEKIVAKDELEKTLNVEEKADDIKTEMLDTIPVKEEVSLVKTTTGLESRKGDDPLHPSEQSVIVSESEIKKQTVTEIETEKIDVAEGDIQQEKEVIVVKEQLATEEKREIKETTEEKEFISKSGAEEIVLTTDKEIKQDKSSVVAKEDITVPKKQTEEEEDEVQVDKVRGEEKQAKSHEDITIDDKVVINGKADAKDVHETEKVATTESVIAEDKASEAPKEKIHVTLDEKDAIVEEEKVRIDETTVTYVDEDKTDTELKEKVEKEQVTEKTDAKEEKVEFIDDVTKGKERIDDNACIEGKIVKEVDKQSRDDKVVDDHKTAAEKIEVHEQADKDEIEATEDKSAMQEKEVAHEKETLKDEDKVITKEKEIEEEKDITADKEEELDKKVVEKEEKITSEDKISEDKKEIEIVKATEVEKGERLEETTIKEGVEVDEGEMKHDKITAVETHIAMEKEAEVKEITTKEKLTTLETKSKEENIPEDKTDTKTKEEKLITEDKADTEKKGVKEKEVAEEKTRIEAQGILIGDQQTGDEKMAIEEKEIEESKSVVQTIQTAEEKLTTEEKPIMPKEDIIDHKISIEDEETVEPAKEKEEEKEFSETKTKSTEKEATVEDKVVTEEIMESKTEEQATICEKEREKLTTDLKEPTIEKEEGVEKITSLPLGATKLDEKSTQDLAETHVEVGTISERKESQSAIQLPSTITEGDSKPKEVEESKKVDASTKSISSTEEIGAAGKVADISSQLEVTVRKDSKGIDIEDSKEIVEGTKDIEEVSVEKVTPSPDLKSTETVLPHSEKSPAEIIEKEADKIAPPTSSISDGKEKSSHLSGTSSPVSAEKVTPPDSPDLKSTETVLPHSEKSHTEIIEKEADKVAPPTPSISDAKEKSSHLSGKSSPVSAVEETLSEGKDGLEQKTSSQQELGHHLSSVADDLLSVDAKDKDIDIATEGQKDKSPIISRTASPDGKADDKVTQTTPSERKDSISLEKMTTPKLQEEQKHIGVPEELEDEKKVHDGEKLGTDLEPAGIVDISKLSAKDDGKVEKDVEGESKPAFSSESAATEEESEHIPHEVVDKEATGVVRLEKDFEVESKSAEIPLKDTVAKVEQKEREESDHVPHKEDSKMVVTVTDVATSIKGETSPDLIDGHAKSEKVTQEPLLETKQEECAKLIKSSDILLQELKSEIHEKLGEQKIESSTLQYPNTEEVKEKSQMSSGKVSPDVTVKEVLAAEKCITPPEGKSPSRSGKTSPVIMLEGKETSVPSDKPILLTELDVEKPSDQTSGRSSPEIVELTKDLLDTKHTPIISRKSTPEIIVDNEFVDSDRLSPEIDVVETEKEDAEVGSQMIHITESVSEVPKSGVESKDATDVPGVPSTDAKTEHIQGVVSESHGTDSVEPSLSIVSEASTSAETKIEISDVKEGTDLSSGRTTPPTAPVSPIFKDKPASFNDKSVEKKEVDVLVSKAVDRSATPASDDCDISSGQVSRVLTTEEDDDKQVYSDDEEIPGSPLSATSQIAHSISSQYDFEDSVRGAAVMDPMSTSFYGALPDDPLDFNKEMKATRVEDSHGSPSHIYEITTARFTNIQLQEELQKEVRLEPKPDIMTASFIGSELPSDSKVDPIASWGKPLGLPSPAPLNDNKGTPKKEKKILTNMMFKNRLNEDKKSKKVNPVYVDLTYVPHNGNSNYSYVDFFKRVRARYYVFSGIEPSKEVYSALLEAKQTWDDKDLEVTIIPTYDTDVLGYWVAENEDLLAKYKIDLSPSASRCTINLQDHETSCSAYRLEFS